MVYLPFFFSGRSQRRSEAADYVESTDTEAEPTRLKINQKTIPGTAKRPPVFGDTIIRDSLDKEREERTQDSEFEFSESESESD